MLGKDGRLTGAHGEVIRVTAWNNRITWCFAKAFERFDAGYAQFKNVMQNFSISETAHRTPVNRKPRIRNLVSYFLPGDVQARSTVQVRQRTEGKR
jgi:hypothetical protein